MKRIMPAVLPIGIFGTSTVSVSAGRVRLDHTPKVGMSGMDGFSGMNGLAGMNGFIWPTTLAGRPVDVGQLPTHRLPPLCAVTHAAAETSSGQRSHDTAGPASRGTTMAATDLIIAIGIFVMGAALGLVAVVSIGILYEERLFRENRQYREERGTWPGPGPGGPAQFFSVVPPGLVCHGARALTGLWIRREQGVDPLVVPRYERRPH
jgi:hypothetical protein